MASVTYNDGMYTPFEESAVAAVTAAPVHTSIVDPTSIDSLPVPTTALAVTPTTTSTPDNGLYTWTAPSTSSVTTDTALLPTVLSISPTLFSDPISSSNIVSTPSPTALPSITSIQSSTRSSSTSSAAATPLPDLSDATTASSFKTYYLTPLFILFPVVLGFLVYWKYGRKNKSRYHNDTDDGWGGRGNNLIRGTPVDEQGLVESKWMSGQSGSGGNEDEKNFVPGGNVIQTKKPGFKWATLFDFNPFRNRSPVFSSPRSSPYFSSSPYASVESPFIPPSTADNNLLSVDYDRHDRTTDRPERGWSWGARAGISPHLIGRGRDGMAPIEGEDEARGKGLTAGWRSAAQKYRPKIGSSGKNSKSRLASLGSERGMGGRDSRYDGILSPSIYSGNDEYRDDATVSDTLDSYLSESRVGHNDLAQRYLHGGQLTAAELAINNRSRPDAQRYSDESPVRPRRPDSTFRVEEDELPAPPQRTHVSPTKSALVRPMPPTPTRPDSSTSSHLFTYSDASSPHRTAPEILPPTSSATRRFVPRANTTFGSAMPAYESGTMRESESTLSLSGVRGLIFGEEEEEVQRRRRVSSSISNAAVEVERRRRSIDLERQSFDLEDDTRRTPTKASSTTGSSLTSTNRQHRSGPLIFSNANPSPAASAKPVPSRVRQAIAEVEARSSPPASPAFSLSCNSPIPSSRRPVNYEGLNYLDNDAPTSSSHLAAQREEEEATRISDLLQSRRRNSNVPSPTQNTSSFMLLTSVTEESERFPSPLMTSSTSPVMESPKRRSISSPKATSYRRPMGSTTSTTSMMSTVNISSGEGGATPARVPLSSDTKRLSAMLRASHSSSDVRRESNGSGLEAMLRRE